MKALVLAGGRGTRLETLTGGLIPKPLVKVNGVPMIERAIERLSAFGVTELFLSVGYLHEKIVEYLGDGSAFGVKISYITEDVPLGSGGALYYLKDKVKEPLIVCPGDVIFDVDLDRMLAFHKERKALITLFAHPNVHPYDSDLIVADENGVVKEINKKNSVRVGYYKNLVNAGIFVLDPESLEYFKELKPVNIEHDFISSYIPTGKVFAYKSTEYVKDVGTPERLRAAEKDIERGAVRAKNLKNKQKAVFFDRDGTLNVYKGFIKSADDIELTEGAAEAVKTVNDSGYLAVVVTNQPVVARGDCTREEVEKMHAKIETLLGQKGAYLDAIYYCPHHPHKGYEGEVAELKIVCECRKPATGLITRAEKELMLDLDKCVIIGDGNADIQTGKNAGIKTVLVRGGVDDELTDSPDYTADDIVEAVKFALGGK